ncbi:MAG TPA: Uma2 family endonuclease, partial [Polyangiaceae bacterium]|nr:Uma2 family endonuclease [Polyangiaceae bacterium]
LSNMGREQPPTMVRYPVVRIRKNWVVTGEAPLAEDIPLSTPVFVRYPVVNDSKESWELSEGETMPESVLHDQIVELLKAILAFWAARRPEPTFVARNLAVRWKEDNPNIGVDPDVCVLSPPPPNHEDIRSLRTWLPGHVPPLLAIEVVSENNPRKDYEESHDKYARNGTRELWVFDPLLCGPRIASGPFRLQVWRRDADGLFDRVYQAHGPAYSEVLGAYIVVTDDGHRLRISDDAEGTKLWPTAEEAERAARDAERAANEAALARIAELEALLAQRTK